MDGNAIFLIIILCAIATVGFVVNNWIRMKNGHAPSDDWTGLSELMGSSDESAGADNAEVQRLKDENAELNGKIDTMQDRMIVLETIVTDRGYTLSEEIESLRDVPTRIPSPSADTGVPLNISQKEPQA